MSNQLNPDLLPLPKQLQDSAVLVFEQLLASYNSKTKAMLDGHLDSHPLIKSQLLRVFALSEFVGETVLAECDWFLEFLLQNQGDDKKQLKSYLAELLSESSNTDECSQGLRQKLIQVRNRCMVFIIWRDLNRLADLHETTDFMSSLADNLIGFALHILYEEACLQKGSPVGGVSGKHQKMVVLALGKLGGFELNLSSDVDLVFAYPEAGECEGTGMPNQRFFLELAQNLIKVLDQTSVDGFVFRVDMRLRPYGESGALVANFNAMEIYYAQQGREWERYAWLKARACAGDIPAGEEIIQVLRPFVYRRYLDFGSIESLRLMKARMDGIGRGHKSNQEMERNLKLGPGGIRDVEFIVQLQQLIWGGRYPELQITGFMAALQALVILDLLDRQIAEKLQLAYVFFRNSEHALQAIRDQQTQLLPEDSEDQARIALALGFSSYAQYLKQEDQHKNFVKGEILNESESEQVPSSNWVTLWHTGDLDSLVAYIENLGIYSGEQTEDAYSKRLKTARARLHAALAQLRKARDQPRVGGRGRKRLDMLMPLLLDFLVELPHPLRTLERCVKILESVLRRSSYLVMLQENPAVLKGLLQLVANSGYIASELARNPWLIDEIIDPRTLDSKADKASLLEMLDESLGRSEPDLENFIEVIRNFKESITFAVAAGELNGSLPLMRVSDYLSFSAEAILQRTFEFAFREATAQFEDKVTASDETSAAANGEAFIIVGYGKLGGIELGPASDLDLVFLHDMAPSRAQFLYRLARRLIHILTIRTRSGGLFEIDTRLRPSGRDGTMVSSIEAFERYQQTSAWTWEHQALVRARFVAGDAALGRKFEALRIKLLTRARDRIALRKQVVDMRERMHKSAGKGKAVKQARGGIVDIEFIVQFLVLAWASEYPEICFYTDKVRILEALGRVGLLDGQDVERLTQAYLGLRAEQHLTALDLPDQGRALQAIERYHDWVSEIWSRVLLNNDKIPGH